VLDYDHESRRQFSRERAAQLAEGLTFALAFERRAIYGSVLPSASEAPSGASLHDYSSA
jgi:hypothetical protein